VCSVSPVVDVNTKCSSSRPEADISDPDAPQPGWKRRPRYAGKNPRTFQEKYKELNPDRYGADVQKVLEAGKTPAGSHRAILVEEVLRVLAPRPGEVAIDCTLGFGGHARALLERIRPGGRLVGLDADPLELPRTEARLRAAGFGADVFAAYRSNFAGLPQILEDAGLAAADMILADLGASSMQLDNPVRGFSYKADGPLDMRMNPSRGEPAARLLARLTEEKLARLLDEYSDEPHADLVARFLKRQPIATTQDLCRSIRAGIRSERPRATKQELDASIRRTFQALRISVNDEMSSLDMLLRTVPRCLAPGGRLVLLTFHSGEDRRVKKALQAGYVEGVYAAIAEDAIRPSSEEVRSNPRAAAAKLRWAVRSSNFEV
jgi:16S rRNA (cytosine1402-N4)-methyltransferase